MHLLSILQCLICKCYQSGNQQDSFPSNMFTTRSLWTAHALISSCYYQWWMPWSLLSWLSGLASCHLASGFSCWSRLWRKVAVFPSETYWWVLIREYKTVSSTSRVYQSSRMIVDSLGLTIFTQKFQHNTVRFYSLLSDQYRVCSSLATIKCK